MTVVGDHTRVRSGRPATATATIAVLGFLGVSAVGGAFGFFFDVGMRDEGWLEQIPLITNWAVPGLILGIGFGLGSLVAAYGVMRRPVWEWLAWAERLTGQHWAWTATLVLGIGMVVWIGLQLIWLGVSFLHVIYGLVGLALIALASSDTFRDYMRSGR